VKNPPADDFTFSPVSDDAEFLFGAAKEFSLLPNEMLPWARRATNCACPDLQPLLLLDSRLIPVLVS
jgi:hypothetical protein